MTLGIVPVNHWQGLLEELQCCHIGVGGWRANRARANASTSCLSESVGRSRFRAILLAKSRFVSRVIRMAIPRYGRGRSVYDCGA